MGAALVMWGAYGASRGGRGECAFQLGEVQTWMHLLKMPPRLQHIKECAIVCKPSRQIAALFLWVPYRRVGESRYEVDMKPHGGCSGRTSRVHGVLGRSMGRNSAVHLCCLGSAREWLAFAVRRLLVEAWDGQTGRQVFGWGMSTLIAPAPHHRTRQRWPW